MTTRRQFAATGAFALLGTHLATRRLWSQVPTSCTTPLAPSPEVPPALRFQSGDPVKSPADWQRRRAEILATATQQMYGVLPLAVAPQATVQEKQGLAFNGLAHRHQARLHFKPGSDDPAANLLLYTPVKPKSKHAPVIVSLNFSGNHTLSTDPGVLLPTSWIDAPRNPAVNPPCIVDHRATASCRGSDARHWPLEKLLSAGYAVCTIYRGDIDPDIGADLTHRSLVAAYPDLQSRPDNFSTIGAWAWTLSRMLDYLQTLHTVDTRRAAVFGWSRLGKASVWAGATDPRFAVVLSHESGAGGAKLFHRNTGEDIQRLCTHFPHWFSTSFRSYIGHDAELPFDQHLILASIAPRPLFVASAVDDHNSDPPGEFASIVLASDVYRFLGSEALPSATMPAPGSPLIGRVSYQIRTGGHDVTDYDWDQYLTFLNRYL